MGGLQDLRDSAAGALDRAAAVVAPRLSPTGRLGAMLRAVRRRLPRRPPGRQLYRVVYEFARAYPDAVFVQVGANDGQGEDPLRDEIRSRRWTGVLVEPVPHVFDRLRRHHGGNRRLRLENAAVADHDGVVELWCLPEAEPGAPLPWWSDGLGTLRQDVLLKHRDAIPDLSDRMVRLEVPCLTFDSLCTRHGLESLDLVHIDTEGYDFEVIKLIDLDRLRPRIVMFENYHMDPDTHDACLAHLRRHGYEHLSDGMDTICLRVEGLTARDRSLHRFWERLRDGYVPDSWGPATDRGWAERQGADPAPDE